MENVFQEKRLPSFVCVLFVVCVVSNNTQLLNYSLLSWFWCQAGIHHRPVDTAHVHLVTSVVLHWCRIIIYYARPPQLRFDSNLISSYLQLFGL